MKNTATKTKKPLVIITGASSGLGAAMAQVFSQAGFSLGLISRNIKAMQDLKLPQALCVSADVTNFEEFSRAVATIEAQCGFVNGLINNAGVAKRGEFAEAEPAFFNKVVNVNILGVMNGIKAVLPGMQERKVGTIINVSSVADRSVRPQLATYAATKAAVKSFTESLRVANAKHNIRFCNIAPAKVFSPMWRDSTFQEKEFLTPEEFAKIILWIFEQPQHICIRDLVVAPTSYEP